MKIELDIDEDVVDIVVMRRLKEWYEMCDSHYPNEEDRLYYQNLKQHLRAVINYCASNEDRIDD